MSTTQLQEEGYCQGYRPLVASNITYHFTTELRAVPDDTIVGSSDETICTDHMITAEWTKANGWSSPELKPYGPLSLLPTSSCLHYAFQCFEGMKAYRGYDGRLRLFRPDRNASRFQMSTERISLPTAEPDELLKLIHVLISIDGPKWLPKSRSGSFMYLRPTMIGTQPQLGVSTPKKAMLYIVMSFMGRLDNIPGGMRLETSPDDMVRAWTDGFGDAKVGANYGPSAKALNATQGRGFHQVLWLYGPKGNCTETGGSNFFVVWKRLDGENELITAPLDDKIILDGVTRRSCLDLARLRLGDDLIVTERRFNIQELIEANDQGRLLEVFSCGTAYGIGPISQIVHGGHEINIPTGALRGGGRITNQIRDWLVEIMYGTVEHEWGVVVTERGEE
ncbi:hypothetical protein NPX13_g3359 [Xylaria arbuscula]|uniref:Branched-chain-amino-acid aminotransferase n=1 Tax=Xylaria arbuscula TaxID=114810 RepID=A0A9W8NIV9_9PEZI|nr:hypothetical protein NPX13_g3359 [Xylaria arbuscula]